MLGIVVLFAACPSCELCATLLHVTKLSQKRANADAAAHDLMLCSLLTTLSSCNGSKPTLTEPQPAKACPTTKLSSAARPLARSLVHCERLRHQRREMLAQWDQPRAPQSMYSEHRSIQCQTYHAVL